MTAAAERTPLRVVIADDSYLVREGLRRLLVESQVEVLVAVGSAEELLDAVRRFEPDAVLTDIRMPSPRSPDEDKDGMAGITAAHAIRESSPGTGVVVLSQYVDESYAYALFRDGTAGLAYLIKDRVSEVSVILAALAEVSAGGSVVDPRVVEALVARQIRLRSSPLAALSDRELDVLSEMAQGRGNRGIAAALTMSESTVEKHVNAIFTKLGLVAEPEVHRRVAAVLTFLRDASLRR